MSAETRSPATETELTPKASLTDEEKLQLVAKVSADAIYDWDIVAGMTRWNHGLQTLFGYTDRDVMTHTWWEDHVHPDDRAGAIASVGEAIRERAQFWSMEYRYLRADSSFAYVIDRGYFIYDENGRALHMIGAMVDVTDRVKLAQSQMQAAIEERQRLARDLHDTVAQTLYSLTLLSEAVRRLAGAGDLNQVQAYAGRLGETAQQSLREMRLLVYEMRSPVLGKDGLAKAIQNRLDAVEKRSGIEVRFQTNLAGRLPELLEEGLFYIASEALNNSLKHAMAGSLMVSLCVDDGMEVALEVSDNGRGFDMNALEDEGGIGMKSMKERAEKLGGGIKIRSANDEGTSVLVRIPYQ
jgi:PAS domain S-box-containing protein